MSNGLEIFVEQINIRLEEMRDEIKLARTDIRNLSAFRWRVIGVSMATSTIMSLVIAYITLNKG